MRTPHGLPAGNTVVGAACGSLVHVLPRPASPADAQRSSATTAGRASGVQSAALVTLVETKIREPKVSVVVLHCVCIFVWR